MVPPTAAEGLVGIRKRERATAKPDHWQREGRGRGERERGWRTWRGEGDGRPSRGGKSSFGQIKKETEFSAPLCYLLILKAIMAYFASSVMCSGI